MSKKLTRRDLLKASAAGLGAMSAGGLNPLVWTPQALGQGAAHGNHVLIIHLVGGYSASFGSAGSFMNSNFGGINGNNTIDLGNNLVVHNSFAPLSDFAKANMATVGMQHGSSNHVQARNLSHVVGNNVGAPLQLAASMGGPAANKFVSAGTGAMGMTGNIDGTAVQRVNDMQSAIDALGGGAPDPTMPDRGLAGLGISESAKQSVTNIKGNPISLASLGNGYQAAVDTLTKPAKPFNPAELMQDYQLNGTRVNSFASKIALAEVMFRSDTNVVYVQDVNTWDNHGDPGMNRVFNKMRNSIIPPIATFTNRVFGQDGNGDLGTNRNVTVVLLGDFCRRPANSNHGSGNAVTVFGHNGRSGTNGNVDAQGRLPNGTGNPAAFWAYIGRLAKSEAAADAIVQMGGNGTADGLTRNLALLK